MVAKVWGLAYRSTGRAGSARRWRAAALGGALAVALGLGLVVAIPSSGATTGSMRAAPGSTRMPMHQAGAGAGNETVPTPPVVRITPAAGTAINPLTPIVVQAADARIAS